MSIAFWASVALLLGGAMLFVLPPLLRPAAPKHDTDSPMSAYRDQRAQIDAELAQGNLTPEQHAQALQELQARVVDEVGDVEAPRPVQAVPRSTGLVLAVALILPAGALGLYGLLGTPSVLGGAGSQAAGGKDAPHAMSQEQMEAMVEQLAQKLKASPNDGNGWHMLARSYVAFQRLPEAAEAYDKANQLMPGNPDLLADYADVLAMVNGRSLEGRPEQLAKAALKADPQHQKALSLVGTAAFNRGDFAGAADWWKKLLATVPPGSPQARSIQANIDQALAEGAKSGGTKLAAKPPVPADNAAPPAPAAAGGASSVEGSVTLADAVKASVPPGATVFVYARPADGSRMPLAIMREPAGSFPLRFKLDDSQAMSPQARISLQSEVQLVARISKTGNAVPQPGDLTGMVGPVKVGARDVKLVITEVVK